jgi:hypothetical protein
MTEAEPAGFESRREEGVFDHVPKPGCPDERTYVDKECSNTRPVDTIVPALRRYAGNELPR